MISASTSSLSKVEFSPSLSEVVTRVCPWSSSHFRSPSSFSVVPSSSGTCRKDDFLVSIEQENKSRFPRRIEASERVLLKLPHQIPTYCPQLLNLAGAHHCCVLLWIPAQDDAMTKHWITNDPGYRASLPPDEFPCLASVSPESLPRIDWGAGTSCVTANQTRPLQRCGVA